METGVYAGRTLKIRNATFPMRPHLVSSCLFISVLLLLAGPAAAGLPTVTGITPAAGANTAPVFITELAGTGFEAGATAMLTPANVNPVHKGKIIDGDGGPLLDRPWSVFVSGNFAYVASGNSFALEIVDISDPAYPAHKGTLRSGSGGALLDGPESVFVAGNYAYVASRISDALEIVDVSDPANPAHKGSITHGAGGHSSTARKVSTWPETMHTW
ncbi:MAG: LVIVD repeat protein [Methanoregula sp. PtaU1.Bin051]|nr:MAG: LVIVD repeat protein [Methanoregula sp. PtaU1.Bin051]